MTLKEELEKFKKAEEAERLRKKKQKKGFDPIAFGDEYVKAKRETGD